MVEELCKSSTFERGAPTHMWPAPRWGGIYVPKISILRSGCGHGASQCTTGLLPVAAIDISELLLSYELLRRFCESIRCAPAKAGTTLTTRDGKSCYSNSLACSEHESQSRAGASLAPVSRVSIPPFIFFRNMELAGRLGQLRIQLG